MDTSKEGAMASAVLPPWDKENPEEAGLLCMSEYKDLINKNRVKLCDNLEPDRIWAHLRQLHVLDKVTEERLTYNLPRPDVVLKLLEFIERGPRWRFHGLCRALALTGQSDMIPQGGLEPKVYEECAPPKQLPKSQVKLIREHCRSNVESLMKTCLFDFEGDPDDDTIDISQCFVPVDPMIKGSQHFFQVGCARLGEIQRRLNFDKKIEHLIVVSCPSDAHEVLMQFTKRHPEESIIALLNIILGPQSRFDKQPGDWSEDEWHKLVMELTALDEFSIMVCNTTPLKSMFTIFVEHLSMLQKPMKVKVWSGRVPLANLMSTVLRFNQVPSLSLDLFQTNIVVPNGEDEAILRAKRDRVCGMTRKETVYWSERFGNSNWTQYSREVDEPILRNTNWVTESGEMYVWSDQK